MSLSERRFAFADLIAELRRRHVVRFAIGYCAAAFVLLQLGEIVLPAFGMGELGLRILVMVVVLGFPPGVALAWVYELTRDGIRRTPDSPAQGMLPRVAFFVLTIGIAGGLAGWLSSRGAFTPAGEQEAIALETYDPDQPITSIAVLPLEDFSPDASQAYFVAGLQEELTASLSRLEWLRVASRTSTMQYQATTSSAPVIGRELGVDALVEGSVTLAGDQVRITLQLIHAASDSHIETFRFDREMTDVLALQSEVAMAVTSAIPGMLARPEEVALVATVGPDRRSGGTGGLSPGTVPVRAGHARRIPPGRGVFPGGAAQRFGIRSRPRGSRGSALPGRHRGRLPGRRGDRSGKRGSHSRPGTRSRVGRSPRGAPVPPAQPAAGDSRPEHGHPRSSRLRVRFPPHAAGRAGYRLGHGHDGDRPRPRGRREPSDPADGAH